MGRAAHTSIDAGIPALLVLALQLIALPADASTFRVAEAAARIEIAGDGRVATVQLKGSLGHQEEAEIQRQILQWRFEPVLRDGQPVVSTADVALAVSAGADGIELRLSGIRHADLPDPPTWKVVRPRAPRFPPGAVRQGLGARFTLLIEIDPDGKVVRAGFAEGEVHLPSAGRFHTKSAEGALDDFVESAKTAVMTWEFPPSEEGSNRFTPIPFAFNTQNVEGPWRHTQTLRRDVDPWICAQEARSTLHGETLKETAGLRLLTDVERVEPDC